ncbi:MAG: beta-ketoacyl-[acyl-carrier-protein] synthase II, partial [Rhodothermaceae bacterium]|nr:beta-ketoacyl-[acyl-carrier-protein] synthase II [Rhodothermaceae bacterium]
MTIAHKSRRVVVTGMGALTPLGHSPDVFWEGLMEGKSGAAPITHFDAENFATKFACEVRGFNPLDHLDRREARKMDPFAQYAVVAAAQAVEHSGLEPDKMSQDERDRTAVVIGSGIGGLQVFHEQTESYIKRGP